MTLDDLLTSSRFPRTSRYHPEWIKSSAGGGANVLWLTEWLSDKMEFRPGMRVLDLGSGRAASSIFLRNEFGVEVWSTDLWFSATENRERIRAAGMEDGVHPIHADARSLPFASEFFDAIVCIDSFPYFGTDDLYLNYLARFVKPDGLIGVAGAGLVQEFDGPVPEHLKQFWSQDLWSMHSAKWLRRHWERTGIVKIELAETMPDGGQLWLNWHQAMQPDNQREIETLVADQGRNLSYIRVIGRRQGEVQLEDYCWPATMQPIPADYVSHPLLRTSFDATVIN